MTWALTSFGNSAYIQSSKWGETGGYAGGASQSWTITATGGDPITVYFDPKSFTEKELRHHQDLGERHHGPPATVPKYKALRQCHGRRDLHLQDMQSIVITLQLRRQR